MEEGERREERVRREEGGVRREGGKRREMRLDFRFTRIMVNVEALGESLTTSGCPPA